MARPEVQLKMPIIIVCVLQFLSVPILVLQTPISDYLDFFWQTDYILEFPLSLSPCPLRKFLNLVPPDALKMHFLAVPVLRFLCKAISKLRKLNNETLFSMDV